MYRRDKPNEPNQEGLLSYVLHESPFASVSTVQGPPLSGLSGYNKKRINNISLPLLFQDVGGMTKNKTLDTIIILYVLELAVKKTIDLFLER